MHYRKLLLPLVLLCLMLCAALTASAEENLIVNGSFDRIGADGLPEGWYTDAWFRQEGYSAFDIVTDPSEGSAARIINFGMNDARFAQKVRVEPESLYRLTGRIRGEGISEEGRGANLSVEGLYVFSEPVRDTGGEWVTVEIYGETGPGQTEVTILARLGGYSGESTGTAWFDDITLTEVQAVPGFGIADLWFTASWGNDDPDGDWEGEEETAAQPFWPWLIILSALFAIGVCAVVKPCLTPVSPLAKDSRLPWQLPAGLAFALLLRLVIAWLVEGYQVDIGCFLSWGQTMANAGPAAFYQSTGFCDYPPAYMYVLGLNHLMAEALPHLKAAFVLKWIPMLADMVMALLIYRMAAGQGWSRRRAVVPALIAALNPAQLIASAAWGQVDSVLCLGLLLVVYFAMKRQWAAVLPLYVLTILMKPQGLMAGPLGLTVLVVEWLRDKSSRKKMLLGLALSAVTAAAVIIPCGIRQQPGWLISLYGSTLSSYPYATINTANLYYLLGGNWVPIANAAPAALGLILAAGCGTWSAYLYTVRRKKQLPLAEAEPLLSAVLALAFAVMALLRASWGVVGTAAMAACFLLVLPMLIRTGLRSREDMLKALPLLGAVLFILLYVAGVKMHERYLCPALILLAAAFVLYKDKRIGCLLAAVSVPMFINTGIVLDNSLRLGSAMGHLNQDNITVAVVLSVINVLTVPAALLTAHRLTEGGNGESAQPAGAKPAQPEQAGKAPDRKLHRLDVLLMAAVTLVYAVISLTTLGSTRAPQKAWRTTAAEEYAVIDLGDTYTDFSMLYFCGVSYHPFTVQTSPDGESFENSFTADMAEGQCYRWKYLSTAWGSPEKLSGRYVRIQADQINLTLYETLFRDADGHVITGASVMEHGLYNSASPLLSDPAALIDEPDTLEGEPGWWNSTYFDEIYHARTAYEHLHGQAPYETSHPPLGKILMAASVAVFGMTPFGWRFAGCLAGILMLPVLYALGKRLTGRTLPSFAAMTLLALDCMHLTQTQIATIDSFPVLFIMLAFLFMLRFLQRDMLLSPLRQLVPELALSGFFMGCAIASKWIGIYAGAGLAVLFFSHCIRQMVLAAKADKAKQLQGESSFRSGDSFRRFFLLCLWCVLFFILIPAGIYLISYIPYFAYTKITSLRQYLTYVIDTQAGMFNYHATPGLGMDHPYYSPWYEWPLNIRPMYYAMASYVPDGFCYSIFCFGNPVVWTSALLSLLVIGREWLREHVYALPEQSGILHIHGRSGNGAFAFLLIGLAAQFLPWMLVPRGTYIYHYFASIPFLILMLSVVPGILFGEDSRPEKLATGILLAAALIAFILFFPYASGITVPDAWLDLASRFLSLYHA